MSRAGRPWVRYGNSGYSIRDTVPRGARAAAQPVWVIWDSAGWSRQVGAPVDTVDALSRACSGVCFLQRWVFMNKDTEQALLGSPIFMKLGVKCSF